MGWAFGLSHDGREIGYGVEATCEQEGCTEKIDRGLAFLCGDLSQVLGNDGVGCGHYFCSSHVYIGYRFGDDHVQLCGGCGDRYVTDDDMVISEDEDGRPLEIARVRASER